MPLLLPVRRKIDAQDNADGSHELQGDNH